MTEEGVGSGVPDLLPGWLAISDISGPKRMVAIDGLGVLLGELSPEAVVGTAEPIAVSGETMLLARPAGRAMRLEGARCVNANDADAGAP